MYFLYLITARIDITAEARDNTPTIMKPTPNVVNVETSLPLENSNGDKNEVTATTTQKKAVKYENRPTSVVFLFKERQIAK